MTKLKGFKIKIDAFLAIDAKDFGKQAAAYATIDGIQKTGKLPDGFLDTVTIVGIDAKIGSHEVPDAPANTGKPATTE